MRQPNISRAQLFKEIGYKPHSSEQWEFHESEARFKVPCCGRRFGKTTMASNELTYQSFKPDTYYWIVGPSYSVGEKEFRILHHNFVKKLGLNELKGFKIRFNIQQGDMRIELPWNTIIEVKSAERPDSLLGEGLDGVIFSEAATHTRQTWEMYIRPALSDKRGWAFFPSTPRGYNWYQGLWLLGQDPNIPDYESWRFPSWANTAVFPGGRNDPEILEIELNSTAAYFAQEYGAEFTAFEGQIYDDFDSVVHVTDIEYNSKWKNFRAWDFGFADPTVCLDIMVDPMDNVYVWREYQVRRKNTWEHGQAILLREDPPGYHVDMNYYDPRGPDEASTLSMILGGGWSGENVPWSEGIGVTQQWMKIQGDGKPKIFFDRSCTETIRQVSLLRHHEVKEGKNVRTEGQHDYDDHGADALRYFMGPYFFLRMGGHLSDVYGSDVRGTEAESFFRLHSGFTRSLARLGQ